MSTTNRRSFLAACAAAGVLAPAVRSQEPEQPHGFSYGDLKDWKLRTRFAVNIEMWGFGTQDHAERIRKAADLGFNAVELWPWRGKDLATLVKAGQDAKVVITQFTAWGFSPGLNDPANHDAFLKEIEASCDAADRLGVKLMTVVAGNDIAGKTQAEMHAAVIDGLKRAAPIAEKRGVTLMLEPMNIRLDHKGHCLYGSAPALRIVKAVGSPHVKVLWDLYHMQMQEGDLCGHLRDGIAEIAYVQAADAPGRNEPGTGEVRWSRVFRELSELGYRGWVGLECSPLESEAKAAERVRAADSW